MSRPSVPPGYEVTRAPELKSLDQLTLRTSKLADAVERLRAANDRLESTLKVIK